MTDAPNPTVVCRPGGEGFLQLGFSAVRHRGKSGHYDATRFHVAAQTPREVWDAYVADGYGFWEAVMEEMSQL